jgi:hypothetical protein
VLLIANLFWLTRRVSMGGGGDMEMVVTDKGLPASLGTSRLEALLGCNPVEPRFDGGVPTEARQTFKHRQEDLLGDVVRDMLIGEMARTIADDCVLVFLD